jgi:hypothetical protein
VCDGVAAGLSIEACGRVGKSRGRRQGQRGLQQPIEIFLHIRHPLKLQLQFAPVRARDVLDLGEAACEILGAARGLAAVAHASAIAVSVVSRLVLSFPHRLPFDVALTGAWFPFMPVEKAHAMPIRSARQRRPHA